MDYDRKLSIIILSIVAIAILIIISVILIDIRLSKEFEVIACDDLSQRYNTVLIEHKCKVYVDTDRWVHWMEIPDLKRYQAVEKEA